MKYWQMTNKGIEWVDCGFCWGVKKNKVKFVGGLGDVWYKTLFKDGKYNDVKRFPICLKCIDRENKREEFYASLGGGGGLVGACILEYINSSKPRTKEKMTGNGLEFLDCHYCRRESSCLFRDGKGYVILDRSGRKDELQPICDRCRTELPRSKQEKILEEIPSHFWYEMPF